MRWLSPEKRSSMPWCTSPSRRRRSPTPEAASRSTVPCSSTPARTRSSTCWRVRLSITTQSMLARRKRWARRSPAGPAPMIPTWVRIAVSSVLRPRLLAAEGGEAGRGHAAGPRERLDLADVDRAPRALRLARGEALHEGRVVEALHETVDPAEAQRFFDGLRVGEPLLAGVDLVEADPELL